MPPANPPANPPPHALREAHCHLAMLGASLALPTLEACASLAELLATLPALAARTAPGQWLRILSARHQAWPERRWPTLAELDAATGHTPTVIMSFDWHESLANCAALAAANLTPGQRISTNGLVQADAHGRATGLLIEHAAYAAWHSAPPEPPTALITNLRAALHRYHALGFVEVHDLRTEPAMAHALLELDARGELANLNLRVVMFPLVQDLPGVLDLVAASKPTKAARATIGGGKLFVDGTLNARTAATLQPCADPLPDHPLGHLMATPDEIDNHLRTCDALNLPLATHALGDRAVREMLNAIDRVRPRTPGTRLEHCELIDPADIPRFAQLGVTASLQPCHLLADIPVLTRLHAHALHKVLPIRALLDSGLTPGSLTRGVIFGSDAPIVRPEPEDSILAAMTLGDAYTSLNPTQAITDTAAWQCFAIN